MLRQLLIACFVFSTVLLGCAQEPEQAFFIPTKQDSAWGFIDRDGNWIIEPQYDLVEIFVDGMARVNYGGLWGYLNEAGEEVVEPTFDLVLRFSEGKGAVKIGGAWGFVDRTGKVVIPIKFQYVRAFSDSLAPVEIDSLIGYLDHTGNVVIDPIYSDGGDFREGASRVTEDGELFGLLTKDRKLLGGRWFEDVRPPSQGRFAFMQNGRWGFKNMGGKVIVEAQYAYTQDYTDGRAVVGNPQQQEFGLLDLDGNVVIDIGVYSFIRPYRNGFAMVRRDGGWGFINVEGDEVVPTIPGVAYREFSDTRAAYRDTTGRWGFINDKNKVIIQPQFDLALDFQEGVCLVRVDGKRGYINAKGEYIWEPSF